MSKLGNLVAGGLALSVITGGTLQAMSAPSYDGLWSVVIVTETGTCDRAYRYPVRISNGTLINAGDEAFVITGKVSSNGAVTVTVSHGDKNATGSGRLSGNAGAGSWTGGECSGTWEAERRNR
jgi:dUTPase